MIEIRRVSPESWLDPSTARKLSARLGAKLWERCKGRKGLFVTLTYDRSRWSSALELYRRQSEEQHVPLFLRKVARYLGESFKGRWFCKLEFQKGGWVHWHLIILDVHKIPHEIATELWGHGHVWLRRLNRRNVRYTTKYTVKAGDVPAWLYAERIRSVKVIRVSPGFWGESREVGPDVAEPGGDDESDDAYGPVSMRIGGLYRPIGDVLDRGGESYLARDERGNYWRGEADFGSLLVSLLERGCAIVGRVNGWLVVRATRRDVDGAGQAAARRAKPGGPPLHLIEAGNPDAKRRCWIPRWLYDWFVWGVTA